MANRTNQPTADFARLWQNNRETAHKRATMRLFENILMVENVEDRGEVELPITSLYKLGLLTNRMKDETFDPSAWQSYLATDPNGSVTVPMGWVTPLLEAFERYRFDEDEPSLDKAFGANRTETRNNARKEIENLVHYARLAAMVQAEQLSAIGGGKPISLEEAKARVEDILEGEPIPASQSTINRAWTRWGDYLNHITRMFSGR